MPKNYKDNEIYLERIYQAPVKLVWDVWMEADHVSKWWGPRGFTITNTSKEVKPGGEWVYMMHGPDKKDYPNKTKFIEVLPYKKIVYDHGGYDGPPMFRVTVNFIEFDGKTKIEMWMSVASADIANNLKKHIKNAFGDSNWDRLAEYLEEIQHQKDIFVYNRTFHAPINSMWDAWTIPENLCQWMSPTGTSMTFINAEIKVGGTSFYHMTNGQEMSMYGKAKYIEMDRPVKLVYIQNFADQDGNLGKHPMAPTWPSYMKTTIEFFAENELETRICISWEIYGDASPEERAIFHQAKAGMTMGWSGSLDKLEDFFSK